MTSDETTGHEEGHDAEKPFRPLDDRDDSTRPPPDGSTPTGSVGSMSDLRLSAVFEPEPDAPPAPDPLLGMVIGGVRLVRVIGQGGMGKVYEGEQQKPRFTVAVKVMRPGLATPAMRKRFEYEAEILARLRHPGIAQIFSAGVESVLGVPVPYFVMEYIPGARTLTDYAEGLKLPTRARLDLFRSVCEAMAHGHQKGVVHRDLKPGNILVDADGSPKVIDFGVAKATDSDLALTTMHSDVGQFIGTLQYMGPEQIDGDPNEIDTRCDVYALGVVLYELLTGKLPYDVRQKARLEVMRIVKEEEPTPISAFDRTLRRDVAVIAGKCLEKDRVRRYSSASELGADVARHLAGEPIQAKPQSFIEGVLRLARKHRAAAAATAGVFAALVAAIIGIGIFARHADVARQHADKERLAADEARAAAEEHRQQAEDAERRTQQANDATKKELYVSQITRLQQLVDQRRMDVAQPLLNELIRSLGGLPTPVELGILGAQCDGAIAVLSVPDLQGDSANGVWHAGIDGKTVRVFNPQSRNAEPVLVGHDDTVKQTTFSVDRRRVATTSLDKTVRVWDSESGEPLSVLADHAEDGLDAVAFSSDATKIATATIGNIVRIWDVKAGVAVATFVASGHQGRVSNIFFSQDAKQIVTVSQEDERVCLWNIGTGALLNLLSGPKGFRWFGDGKQWPFTKDMLPLRVKNAVRHGLDSVPPEVKHEDLIASVTEDDTTTVRIQNIRRGEALALLAGHQGPVTAIEFRGDGKQILTISAGETWTSTGGNSFPVKGDATVRIWDVDNGGAVPVLPGQKDKALLSVAFTPDGNKVATVDVDGTSRIWDALTCTFLATLPARDLKTEAKTPFSWQGSAHTIAFSPDGARLATAPVTHATASLWDTSTGQRLASLDGHEELAFSPDGTLIATTTGSNAFLWDAQTGTRRAVLAGSSFSLLAFNPSCREIATAGASGLLILSTASGTSLRLLPSNAASIAFSPDGSRLVTGEWGDATVWDVHTGSRINTLRGHYGIVTAVGFSPSGETIMTAAKDRTARIWDPSTGTELAVCSGHDATIRDIAFSPDGLRVATASEDHTCRVWDAKSGVQLAVLSGHKGPVWAAVFSPDGKKIATASSDGTARLWGVSNAEIYHARLEAAAIEERLYGTITDWLKDDPDAAVAKLRASRTTMSADEYRVAGNMILSRSCAMRETDATAPADAVQEPATSNQ